MATTAQLVRTHGFWVEFSIESVAVRVCREAGGRVTTNVRVQDLDLPPRAGADNRRLAVVADGLPLFYSAQLAIDTTMVFPLRRDGRHSITKKEISNGCTVVVEQFGVEVGV